MMMVLSRAMEILVNPPICNHVFRIDEPGNFEVISQMPRTSFSFERMFVVPEIRKLC